MTSYTLQHHVQIIKIYYELAAHMNLVFAFRIQTWRILRWNLRLQPYKIQVTKNLKFNDHRQSLAFADWVLEFLEKNPGFGRQIILREEVQFLMNGYEK